VVDEERAAALREEARILFQLRNMAAERVAAGDDRAEALLAAVTDLIADRERESEEALRLEDGAEAEEPG
jgi:hypothetical protein